MKILPFVIEDRFGNRKTAALCQRFHLIKILRHYPEYFEREQLHRSMLLLSPNETTEVEAG